MVRAASAESQFSAAGEAARRRHAAWLTRALRLDLPVPAIPILADRAGGFSAIMARADGRAWAREWWEGTLARADLDLPDDAEG